MRTILPYTLCLFVVMGTAAQVLAQAPAFPPPPEAYRLASADESEVVLSTEEFARLVRKIRSAHAARYAPQQAAYAATTTQQDARLDRLEAMLDQLISLELTRATEQAQLYALQPQAQQQARQRSTSPPPSAQQRQRRQIDSVRQAAGQAADAGDTPRSREAALQLRVAELGSQVERLTQQLEAERRSLDQRMADQRTQQQQNRSITDNNNTTRETARQTDALREDIRRLERQLAETERNVGRSSRTTPAVPPATVVVAPGQNQSPPPAPTVDTAALLQAERQRLELQQLRSQLAVQQALAAQARRVDTVTVVKTVAVPSTPIVVRDTVRTTKELVRTVAPTVEPVGAVYFASGSTSLGEASMIVLEQALRSYRAGAESLRLRGFSSPDGNPTANLALSQKRATAVRDALIAKGVPPTAILILQGGIDRTGSAAVARRVDLEIVR